MVKWNHIYFLNVYFRYQSENYIIAWWVHQNSVELRRKEMQTIISSSVIQLYVKFYHPNWIIWITDTSLCVVVSVAYLKKICILPCWHDSIFVWNTSKTEVTMRKTEGLMKYPVVFSKPIIMQYNLMVVIFIIALQIWTWKQCYPLPLNIMGYRTENVCYAVLISTQVLSYLFRRQLKIQQTCVQQCNFTFTVMFHVVLFIGDTHTKNEQHVHCVPQWKSLTVLPKYTHEKNLCY